MTESEPGARKNGAIRGWLIGAAIVVIGGAASVGIVALARTPAPSPSASPGASSSPSATVAVGPSPVVSVDADGRALPGFVTIDDSLPQADPLLPEIWETITPGWTLAIVAPRAGGQAPEHQVLYLVSPEGQRYQVLELDPAQPVGLLAWTAGESRAIVTVGNDSWVSADYFSRYEWPTHSLDLETGTLSEISNGADEVMALPEGNLVWSFFAREGDVVDAWVMIERGGETVILDGYDLSGGLSPDGRYFTVWGGPDGWVGSGESLVDSVTLEIVPFDHGEGWICGVVFWLDADTYLESCGADIGLGDFSEVNVLTSERTFLTDNEATLWPLVGASCITADGQPWGAWLQNWGEWYEPWTITVGGGSGEPHEIALTDSLGALYERTSLLGCGSDSLIIQAEHTGDEMGMITESTLFAYWPADGRQSILIPRPASASGWDYYLWSVLVAR